MLGTLLAAQAELSTILAELRRGEGAGDSAGLIADCGSQLGALYALQQSVSAARPADLVTMRREIGASIASAQGAAQQARITMAATAPDGSLLAAITVATRREVETLRADLFERRIFDRHLQFASAEEEDAYRRREAENCAYIDRQLAAKTPEGDLNAAGATMGQMLDAHGRGAGASPEFLPRWNRLVETTRKHRDALRAEGRSTDEFDRNLAASVRRYLRDKGLSEAEIEARLAISADPLAAVKPYLKTEQDAKLLSESVDPTSFTALAPNAPITRVVRATGQQVPPEPVVSATSPDELGDVMATFRAAGIIAAPPAAGVEHAHGINASMQDVAAEVRGQPR